MSDSDNPGPQTVAEVQRHSEDAPGQTKKDKELEYMWEKAVIAYKEVTEKDLKTLPLPTTDEIKKNISETNKEDEENVKSAASKKILEGLLQLGEIAADAASEVKPHFPVVFASCGWILNNVARSTPRLRYASMQSNSFARLWKTTRTPSQLKTSATSWTRLAPHFL